MAISVIPEANSPFPRRRGTSPVLYGNRSPNGLMYAPQSSLYLLRDSVIVSSSINHGAGVIKAHGGTACQ